MKLGFFFARWLFGGEINPRVGNLGIVLILCERKLGFWMYGFGAYSWRWRWT